MKRLLLLSTILLAPLAYAGGYAANNYGVSE